MVKEMAEDIHNQLNYMMNLRDRIRELDPDGIIDIGIVLGKTALYDRRFAGLSVGPDFERIKRIDGDYCWLKRGEAKLLLKSKKENLRVIEKIGKEAGCVMEYG